MAGGGTMINKGNGTLLDLLELKFRWIFTGTDISESSMPVKVSSSSQSPLRIIELCAFLHFVPLFVFSVQFPPL